MTSGLLFRRGVRLSAIVVLTATVAILAVAGGEASTGRVSCGDTITADTTLDADLVNCPNNGIVIGADGLTLDLNGHRVVGDGREVKQCPEGQPCDVGLVSDGHDDVTIKGGTIKDFGLGVAVFRARNNRLRNLSIVENPSGGIIMMRSVGGSVQRSSASRNGLTPGGHPGIWLLESHNNRIADNTLSGNGDLGLELAESDHNHISSNMVRRNPEEGMIIEGDGNEIVRNRLAGGGGGILISIISNGGRAVGNVVRRNRVLDSGAGGIAVDPGPKRTLLSRNYVRGAGGDGINVLSRSTRLTQNQAVRNADLGIQAVRGVIDGGGNKASGNGDPRQCIHIVCN